VRAGQGGKLSRKEIDDYTAYVARYGAKGLAYVKVNDVAKGREGLQSPILKFLSDAAVAGILERTAREGRRFDFLRRRFGKVVSDALGALRLKVGQDLKLVERAGGRCGWWISRCSNGTRRRSAGRPCIIRSPAR
jgi:aspartyl-tRNA synthetase